MQPSLTVTFKEMVGDRMEETLRDEQTGREFLVTEFFTEPGQWTASELRPNGRFFSQGSNPEFLEIDSRAFAEVSGVPTETCALISGFKERNPGYDPLLRASARTPRTIRYRSRDEAMQAIESAILSDTWLVEAEPVRNSTLPRPSRW
jgi:hypothetical protein